MLAGTSNAMFDELAERSLMSPLAGTKHTYVRLAIIIHCLIQAYWKKDGGCAFYHNSTHGSSQSTKKAIVLQCFVPNDIVYVWHVCKCC